MDIGATVLKFIGIKSRREFFMTQILFQGFRTAFVSTSVWWKGAERTEAFGASDLHEDHDRQRSISTL